MSSWIEGISQIHALTHLILLCIILNSILGPSTNLHTKIYFRPVIKNVNRMKRNNFVVLIDCFTVWMTKLMTQPSRCVYYCRNRTYSVKYNDGISILLMKIFVIR